MAGPSFRVLSPREGAPFSVRTKGRSFFRSLEGSRFRPLFLSLEGSLLFFVRSMGRGFRFVLDGYACNFALRHPCPTCNQAGLYYMATSSGRRDVFRTAGMYGADDPSSARTPAQPFGDPPSTPPHLPAGGTFTSPNDAGRAFGPGPRVEALGDQQGPHTVRPRSLLRLDETVTAAELRLQPESRTLPNDAAPAPLFGFSVGALCDRVGLVAPAATRPGTPGLGPLHIGAAQAGDQFAMEVHVPILIGAAHTHPARQKK